MLRHTIIIICILIALAAFPELYTGNPLLTGNAKHFTEDGRIITATAYLNNDLSINEYYGKNIRGALNKDAYLFMWDYNNHLDIYNSNNTDILMHSIEFYDTILSVFFDNSILIVQTERQTEFFYLNNTQLTDIRSPFNLHVTDAAFIRNSICLSAGNGNMIIHVNADSSGIILNDTVYTKGTDAIFKNNFDVLCVFRDTLLEYYIVTDTSLFLYSQHNEGRNINGYRLINDSFYCWSDKYLYILDNNLVFNMQCIDSVSINWHIEDISILGDSIYILSPNDMYITNNTVDLTFADTAHISDNILSIFAYDDDFLIWTYEGIKYLNTFNDSLYVYNDSLLPLYILWDHVICADTTVYYEQNDSLMTMKLREFPVSVSHTGNSMLYADADYNVYNDDTLIMAAMYPVNAISQYRGMITANGYYGFMSMDSSGELKYNAFQGQHCLYIDSVSSGIVMATDDYIALADTMLNTICIYPISIEGICRTDTMLYINSFADIIAVDDSIFSVLHDNNYKGISMFALGAYNGAMLMRDNVVLELNYEMTGFNEPISRSIDSNKQANYIIYDIMGRFRGLNNAQNTLKGVYFIRNGEETEKMINIQ